MYERQLEDWALNHPEEAFWPGMLILGCQILLPHGRLDLLGYDGRVWVIELKTTGLQEKHIGQLMRYKADICLELRRAAERPYCELISQPYTPIRDSTIALIMHRHEIVAHAPHNQSVQAMLVGPSCQETIAAAALGANIEVMLWRQEGTNLLMSFYDFYSHPDSLARQQMGLPIPEWAQRVSELFITASQRDAEQMLNMNLTNKRGAVLEFFKELQ